MEEIVFKHLTKRYGNYVNGIKITLHDSPPMWVEEVFDVSWGYAYSLFHKWAQHLVGDEYCFIQADNNNSQNWFKKGKFHRLDGPAVVKANGKRFWYKNGKELRPRRGTYGR